MRKDKFLKIIVASTVLLNCIPASQVFAYDSVYDDNIVEEQKEETQTNTDNNENVETTKQEETVQETEKEVSLEKEEIVKQK